MNLQEGLGRTWEAFGLEVCARLGRRGISSVAICCGAPSALFSREHHGFSRQPSRENAFGKRRAATTQSADAAKRGDIIVSDRAASGGIDRFGGGTRPTALVSDMGRRDAECEEASEAAGELRRSPSAYCLS